MSVSGMKRLNVYVISENEMALVERLIRLRCVQIDEMDLDDGLKRADAPDSSSLEVSLSSVKESIAILSRFSSYRRRASHVVEFDLATVQKDGTLDRARETVSRVHSIWTELESIRLNCEELQRKIKAYEPFSDCQLSEWKENVRESVILGAFPKKVAPEQIEDSLMALNATVEEVFLGRRERYCKILYLPERAEEVSLCLDRLGFVQSDIDTDGKSVEEVLLACESELSVLEDKQAALRGQMTDCADGLLGVEILCDLMATELRANGYLGCFARTESCSILKGWIPAFEADRVRNSLAEFDCAFEIEEPEEGELPPVYSKRRKTSKKTVGAFDPAVPSEQYSFQAES
jgi:V/A-type H+-transporting ATPase subunit I